MGHLAVLCTVLCAVATVSAAEPQVTTHSGQLRGATLKSFLGSTFSSFRGKQIHSSTMTELCLLLLYWLKPFS